jgi:hypothetical protein
MMAKHYYVLYIGEFFGILFVPTWLYIGMGPYFNLYLLFIC